LILIYLVLIIRGSVNFERIVIFISNSYLSILSYNYFHTDRGLRRKQHLRYRQRIHEKSFYCVRKKDLSNSFIENINNSIDSIILFNFLDQLLEDQYQLRIKKMKNQVKITTTKNQKKYRQWTMMKNNIDPQTSNFSVIQELFLDIFVYRFAVWNAFLWTFSCLLSLSCFFKFSSYFRLHCVFWKIAKRSLYPTI
jgi:hypothetical protein